jgi:hypothetical protein
MAERHAADRLLTADDVRRFIGIPHDDLTLHIFFLRGDHEGERFARSIKQELGFGLQWHDRVVVSELDEGKLGSGLLPGGVFGPFGGDQNNTMLSTSEFMLFQAFGLSDFCISHRDVPLSMRQLADPSPNAVSLIIGPKDKSSVYCR